MEEKKLNDTDIDVGMPDEEIIKALGFKALHDAKVAYLDGCACKHIRVKDILDLIHRLQDDNKNYDRANSELMCTIAEQKAEIERLTEELKYYRGELQ